MLRAALPADAPTISRWLSEPSINRWLTSNLRGQGLAPPLVQVALRRKDMAWWLFGDAEADAPAGLVALDSVDMIDGVANLWFVLGEHDKARRGLTSRAIRAFCDANPLGLVVATAWAIATNEASLRTLARAGFVEVGTIANAVALPEGRCGRILFARPFGRIG